MRIPSSLLSAAMALATPLVGVACTGTISDAGPPPGAALAPAPGTSTGSPAGSGGSLSAVPGGGPNGEPAPGSTTYERLTCKTPAIGATALRRLTHREYDNALRDLLGSSAAPGQGFPLDTRAGLFDNTAANQDVPELLAEKYVDTAVAVAEGVEDLGSLVGCDYRAADASACVEGFITRFGRRAYRRPLAPEERASLVSVYDAATRQQDSAGGIRALVASILASPHFLFRPEFGADAGNVPGAKRLSAFEIAARLGSLLWATQPDDELLDAAERGALASPEQIRAQAQRMLDDARARPAIAEFYRQWLGGDMLDVAQKSPSTFPGWNEALRGALAEERRRFLENVLWQGDARYATLLGASYSFVNAPLAELYGVSAPAGQAFARVELDPSQRSGILTQGAFLAAFAGLEDSSPVKRGKWLRVRLLCQELPDPPAKVPELPAPAEGVSTRERFAQHSSDPACKGCHSLIDGLGFGLEQYDAVGRYRISDRGVPVDARGSLTGTGEGDAEYVGGRELGALLARSERAMDCVPTQWLRYAMARRETEDDTCSLAAVRDAFRASGGDLRELLIAVVQSDVFLNYRRPE